MQFRGEPGDAYKPSDGTEGEGFKEAFCCRCERLRDGHCSILTKAFIFDARDEGYPPEWIYNENGSPSCMAFRMVRTKRMQ